MFHVKHVYASILYNIVADVAQQFDRKIQRLQMLRRSIELEIVPVVSSKDTQAVVAPHLK
ncbi:MAG: hypothetical protein K0S54_2058 [Alphaproteobacteria bacterium]|jgi:hypothetical protein|nr:hypothetical protein [Alphaproteobacteria bacterium]